VNRIKQFWELGDGAGCLPLEKSAPDAVAKAGKAA